jgi:hypothetical protein
MKTKNDYHGMINSDPGAIVQKIDYRLDLVNRLIDEITSNATTNNLQQHKVITLEIAQKFLDNKYSVNLNDYQEIENEAATALAHYQGNIHIGLTRIDYSAAVSLASIKGSISFNRLTSLSDAAAKAFANHEGEILYFDGLTSISDSVAESLGQHKGKSLSLCGLKCITDSVAKFLVRHNPDLDLQGLTSLSDSISEVFSGHLGWLFLPNVTNLSDISADFLSHHMGKLSLGLTSLSDSAAESFAKHKGELLELLSVANLSDSAVKSLARYKGGLLDLSNYRPDYSNPALANFIQNPKIVFGW